MSGHPGSLAIVAPNWLGDAVMALPAIADVRRHFTSSRLVVAARGSVADLFRLVPGIDEIVVLRWKGRWWDRRPFQTDAAQLAEAGADVALLLPNSFASAWLVKRAGVPERWGYAADFRRPLLSRAVEKPKGSLHQGRYYQNLVAHLGIDSGPLEPMVRVPDASVADARQLLRARGWDGQASLVVLAAGAAYGTAKRWVPANVAALADGLMRERGAACVLVGTAADRATMTLIHEVMPRGGPALIDVTGNTTLLQLAGILALARVCVSNDSGAMHVAAAVGTPLVAIFGPTREHETGPLTTSGGHADVLTQPVWCRPCMLRECPIDHRCMTGITPERVRGAVDALLEGPR